MIKNAPNTPVIYPLRRMLYSRKILLLALALVVSLLGEIGLPAQIVENFNLLCIAIITSWTAKDVSANLANGKE